MLKLNSKIDTCDDDLESIDHVLGDGEGNLDFDLTESALSVDSSSIPDLILESGKSNSPSSSSENNNSMALVTRVGTDITLRAGSQDLHKMQEKGLLDAHDFQQRKIVHPSMDKYEILNAYREIRTKLIHESDGKNLVIMVVSLQQGMGTTFSAVNLGAAFSYEGEKTSLVVDCDINKRKLSRYFPDNGEFGLTDYLVGSSINIEEIIHQTGIARMRYIPVGTKHQSVGECFSSDRMRNFIGLVKKRYTDRYIILSAPPLETSVDAAILSEISDYIIFVLPYGKVSNDRLNRVLKFIPKGKKMGFVINNKMNHV